MLLSTQDGIGCDLCKQPYREKFIYYSTEILKINFDRSHKLSFVGDSVKSCDICPQCYGQWGEKIVATSGINRSKCDFCGERPSGERYVARLTYVEVDSSKEETNGIVRTVDNYLLIDICQHCIEPILKELEKEMADPITPPPFQLKEIYIGDEMMHARPVQWDGKDFFDGEGRNERGDYINAIAWQTTCPGCGQQIQFGLNDVYIADDGTEDNISCPHCKAGHVPDPMRMKYRDEGLEEPKSTTMNIDSVGEVMKKAILAIEEDQPAPPKMEEVNEAKTHLSARTTADSPFVDPIVEETFPLVGVMVDKLSKLNQ